VNDETVRRESVLRENLSTSDLAAIGEDPQRADANISQPRSAPVDRQTMAAAPSPGGTAATAASPARYKENEASSGPLFSTRETEHLRKEWDEVQSGFVDEPKQAVEKADQLVALTMKRLAEIFADERRKLERHWESGDQVSTEDLRVALQRYRSFFGRLLSV
jgi:hypothetical protein